MLFYRALLNGVNLTFKRIRKNMICKKNKMNHKEIDGTLFLRRKMSYSVVAKKSINHFCES